VCEFEIIGLKHDINDKVRDRIKISSEENEYTKIPFYSTPTCPFISTIFPCPHQTCYKK